MEKSSFFNSVKGDRKYSAEDWTDYFGSIIGNGVFPEPSTGLQVEKHSGMRIKIQPGKAWINGYFYTPRPWYHLPWLQPAALRTG